MILVDRQIADRMSQTDFIESFDPACLTNIGYDIRAKKFYVGAEGKTSLTLMPHESAFVESVETVTMPTDLCGIVTLKNSRIRQGLSLESPVYQPGHKTRIYFRVTNVSAESIILYSDEKYATILFEKLSEEPEHPYNGAFRDEFEYRGLGDYKNAYKRQIREIEKTTEDLKEVEHNIYTNILTILSIFMTLFSLLTMNVTLAVNSANVQQYLIFNALLLGGVSFLVALLSTIVKLKKTSWWYWLPTIVCFAVAFILYIH